MYPKKAEKYELIRKRYRLRFSFRKEYGKQVAKIRLNAYTIIMEYRIFFKNCCLQKNKDIRQLSIFPKKQQVLPKGICSKMSDLI